MKRLFTSTVAVAALALGSISASADDRGHQAGAITRGPVVVQSQPVQQRPVAPIQRVEPRPVAPSQHFDQRPVAPVQRFDQPSAAPMPRFDQRPVPVQAQVAVPRAVPRVIAPTVMAPPAAAVATAPSVRSSAPPVRSDTFDHRDGRDGDRRDWDRRDGDRRDRDHDGFGYRPYVFRPQWQIGFGIFAGYPVPYTYTYPFPVPVYGYAAPSAPVVVGPGSNLYGGVTLDITPNDATVTVDGSYTGIVQSFDGSQQPLTLAAGTHHIEVDRPGFISLAMDVTVQPDQIIPYRGDLQPAP